MKTKTSQVLNHLKKHKKITSWQAIELYRCTRLSAVIFNLKAYGYEIHTEIKWNKDNVRYAVYHLFGHKNA